MNGRAWRKTFYGMSSVKEYWSRASEIARSDFETTSSENSSDDSLSSYKEYRDANCNVDFDDETDDITNEDASNVQKNSTKFFDDLIEFESEKNVSIKSSRYVRWDVLMSLGIGLWAVLCIVDVLHSEESLMRDWLYESMCGKKNVSKIILEKKAETSILSSSNLWPYLLKIVTITTSGGAYILLFLLLIVFCIDPRLRKTDEHSSVKRNIVTKISIPKTAKNSIVEKKSLTIGKKSFFPHLIEQKNPELLSIQLELVPSTYLQKKFLSCIEKRFKCNFTKLPNSPILEPSLQCGKTKIVHIFDQIKGNESLKCFSINKRLVDLLDTKIRATLKFSNRNPIDWNSMTENSASLCLMESTRNDSSFDTTTFYLEISEYLRKKRRKTLTGENFMDKPAVSNNGDSENRIITSSPAFKKFLLNFQQNNCVS